MTEIVTKRKAKLNKWYTIQTRFKLVPAHIKRNEGSGVSNQYRLIIEFPREYRVGYFPFELQLKDGGKTRGLTNYWCNPFGEDEIMEVIQAVQRINIEKGALTKLEIIKRRHGLRKFKMQMENLRA